MSRNRFRQTQGVPTMSDAQPTDSESTEPVVVETTTTVDQLEKSESVSEPTASVDVKQDIDVVNETVVEQPVTITKQTSIMIEQQVQSYVDAMKPGVMNPAEGGAWQKSFFSLLKTILSVENPEEFRLQWSTLLNMVHANAEACFHDNYVYRFPEHWNMSDSEMSLFRRLIFILKLTADPQTRFQQSNQINFDRVTFTLTEVQKNNLISFYS